MPDELDGLDDLGVARCQHFVVCNGAVYLVGGGKLGAATQT